MTRQPRLHSTILCERRKQLDKGTGAVCCSRHNFLRLMKATLGTILLHVHQLHSGSTLWLTPRQLAHRQPKGPTG